MPRKVGLGENLIFVFIMKLSWLPPDLQNILIQELLQSFISAYLWNWHFIKKNIQWLINLSAVSITILH